METTISVENIHKEIERLSGAIEKLEQERARIDEKIAPIRRMRDSYQSIYSIITADAPTAKSKAESDAATAPNSIPASAATDDGYGARSRVMRQHILSSAETGVTPKSVQEHMAKVGLPVSSNFVYKTLGKMKADGEIDNPGGVYRPVAKEVTAA